MVSVSLHSLPLIIPVVCSEDRVRKGAEKLRSAVTAKQQGRLESFFKAPAASSSKKESVNPARAKRLVRCITWTELFEEY